MGKGMHEDPIARALLRACTPAEAGEPPPVLTASQWEGIGEAAERHGLVPRLYEWAASADGTGCPAALRAQWQRAHLRQGARNVCALRQLEELGLAASAAGIRVLALKGAAALFSVYGSLCIRRLDDLDILVEAEAAPTAARVLTRLGYQSTEHARPRKSQAEELLIERRREHLAPFVRADSFPVELHLNLMRRARRETVLGEVWRAAVPVGDPAPGVWLLCPEHFVIHTAVHYVKHLETGFAPLKGLVDILEIAAVLPLDWPGIHRTASRWGVARELDLVLATLRHYWGLELPKEIECAGPIELRRMLEAPSPSTDVPDVDHARYHLTRLLRVRELPDLGSQVAYLVRMLLPAPNYMRYRYHLADDAFLLPYYGRHLATGIGVAVRGAATAAARVLSGRANAR